MSRLFSKNLVARQVLNRSFNLKKALAQTRTMAAATGQAGGQQNRLALEKSPYLLQHANNPVDWYPWGSEAFDKAKQEQKPIFLSVGYSTCHWCHVMERESFENEEIGKILNDNFVAIKVDREERPDVDKVYMTFVQMTTGGGGWPMSVWLTPDLRPIIAGTYFPPNDRYYGRPGFKTVLLNISAQWKAKGSVIEERGTAILDALMAASAVKASAEQEVPGQEVIDKCYRMLTSSYDDRMGGFGKAPKFPQPVNFNFMLRKYAEEEPTSEEGKKAKKMVLHTLKMMAKGGMHDHIAQGFHRYSTDADWHVPHFEKMLYDQGQLTVSYIEAYQISKEEEFAATARDILTYVSRDLSDPSGGFYSAEDADSLPTKDATEKKEGAFCVWTEQEVRSLLAQPIEGFPKVTLADLFCHHYCVSPDGNVDPFQDPHDELKGQNVLIVRGSIYYTSSDLKMKPATVISQLEKAREILYAARKERPPPHLDNKMLTAWNGLMISGFAKAAQALGDQSYTHRALAAVEYVRSNLYLSDEQTLLRCGYVGEADQPSQSANPIRGFLDDYAFLIRGLMDAYEASLDERLLEWAERLQQKQDDLFWDQEGGGYFANDTSDPSIVLRMKDDQDGAEPSGNSVAALNLLRLSNFLDKPEWKEKALTLLKTFGERLEKIPLALPEMVTALQFLKATPKQIIIVGEADSEDTKALLKCVHSYFLPNKVLLLADPTKMETSFLASRVKVIPSLKKVDDKATAYVCENYSCSRPVTSVNELKRLLERKT